MRHIHFHSGKTEASLLFSGYKIILGGLKYSNYMLVLNDKKEFVLTVDSKIQKFSFNLTNGKHFYTLPNETAWQTHPYGIGKQNKLLCKCILAKMHKLVTKDYKIDKKPLELIEKAQNLCIIAAN